METLSRSRPKRVDVAGMVVVLALGAGCLGSAVAVVVFVINKWAKT